MSQNPVYHFKRYAEDRLWAHIQTICAFHRGTVYHFKRDAEDRMRRPMGMIALIQMDLTYKDSVEPAMTWVHALRDELDERRPGDGGN